MLPNIYTPVHLHYQMGGKWLVACIPAGNMGMQKTGDPRAVTCHKCKESEAYRMVSQQMGLPVETKRG